MKAIPIPTGTKDILPSEAAEFRYLEAAVRRIFSRYGYVEVITPTLEKEVSLEMAGEKRLKKHFSLFDDNGEVMVMRPEMTIPISRLVAGKMADREPPFRLCYFANIFRPTRPQRGRLSEFFQAGLELVGIDSPAADAEVIAILCDALDACGLKDYAVALGEASFFLGLLDSAGVDKDGREAVLDAMKAKDLVELSRIVGGLEIAVDDREDILEVASLRGGTAVLSQAQELVRCDAMEAALKRLARTYYLLTRYGCSKRIIFDLGILRKFDYYTGVVFEVLSSGIGFPIGSGGRYNGLLAKFGRSEPAVGFALGLDRLHIAATNQGGVRMEPKAAAVLVGGLDEDMELAAELRENGVNVWALPGATTLEMARSVADENDIPYVIAASGEEITIFEKDTEGVKIIREHLPGALGI